MKKVFMIPALVIGAIALAVVLSLTNSEAQESASPEELATEYLELSKAKEYEQIADMVIDERFPDRQKRIEGYEASASHSAIEEYEIKEVKDVTEDTAKVVAVLTLKDGSVIQMPLHLTKGTGVWKMYISSKGINEDKYFKLIKPATGI